MKKIFPIILTLMLILTLAIAGCGGGNDGDPGVGTLTGHVYYFASFTDIVAKKVQVTIGGNSAYTDDSGYYSISNIAAGTYMVTADFRSVTNNPDPIPNGASMGSSLYHYKGTWDNSVGSFEGSTYNDVILGTENEIEITDGETTTLSIRLAEN